MQKLWGFYSFYAKPFPVADAGSLYSGFCRFIGKALPLYRQSVATLLAKVCHYIGNGLGKEA